jgi:hypothetical protein
VVYVLVKTPASALSILIIIESRFGAVKIQRSSERILTLRLELLANVRGHADDIVHKDIGILEDSGINVLENVFFSVRAIDKISGIDMSDLALAEINGLGRDIEFLC